MNGKFIREAILADVPAMAQVTAHGFIEDDVFGKFQHPHRKQYFDDWTYFWEEQLRTEMLGRFAKSFVVVDEATGKVAATCICKRLGKGRNRIAKQESWGKMLARTWNSLRNKWTEWTWTDRSKDRAAVEVFERSGEGIKDHFKRECWYIDFLCVHPDYQGKGIGRPFLEYVVRLGRGENPPVPMMLISSAVADGFYKRFGFEEVGQACVGEMSGIGGGSIKLLREE